MEPFTIIAIIGLVISVLSAGDTIAGSAMNNSRNSKIAKEAKDLGNLIAEDSAFLEKLRDAYNRRDAAYANALINSSPFGQRFHQLRKRYEQNLNDMTKNTSDIVDQQTRATAAQNDMSEKQSKATGTGSAIGDLISGAAFADTTAPKYDKISNE